MARNTLAIILWVIALLGATGFINPFGFFALLIPLLFIIIGNNFTRSHAKEYFNVLITSVIIYFVGYVLNQIVSLFKGNFDMLYVALIYFTIMSLFGLIGAVNNKKYRAVLTLRVFK